MTMETAQQDQINDEFGYQRFALTEAAYDLITSLIGIYARACFRDPQNAGFVAWQQRLDALHQTKNKADWSDLSLLQCLVDQLSAEYKQAVQIEAEQRNYATDQSSVIHSA